MRNKSSKPEGLRKLAGDRFIKFIVIKPIMSLEQTLEKLKIPEYLDALWLNEEYVKKNGWYPVCDGWLQNYPKEVRFEDTSFGRIPWKSRNEFRPGDIIIFNECGEQTVNGKYETDRFLRIYKEDIEEYQRGERDLLPVGIVVHPPEV